MLVELKRYALPLKHPLRWKGLTIRERQGVLVGLREGSLRVWGDAAPLPGFSRESIEDVLSELEGWTKGLDSLRSPSACWAVDVAQNSLKALQNQCSLAQWWSDTLPIPLEKLPVAELYREGADVSLGSTLKLKVGELPVAEDIERVQQVVELYRPRHLRIDANRAWSLHDVLDFCEQTASWPLEFIEEPCKDPNDWLLLMEQTKVPLALDESLYWNDWDWRSSMDVFKALVVKPTLVGGLDRLKPLRDLAQSHSCALVISSCFESEVGLQALRALACAWQKNDVACGLGTHRWMKEG